MNTKEVSAPSLFVEGTPRELFDLQRGLMAGSAVQTKRLEALQAFEEKGLPTPKNENWKYTGLGSLLNTAFVLDAGTDLPGQTVSAHIIDKEAINLIFINGKFAPAQSYSGTLPAGLSIQPIEAALRSDENTAYTGYFGISREHTGDGLNALNEALASEGIFIRVAKNTACELPVYIYHFSGVGQAAVASQTRNLVIAEQNSQLTLNEVFIPLGEGINFVNTVTEVVSKKDSVLNTNKIQLPHAGAVHVGTTHILQEETCTVNSGTFTFGGKTVRNNLNFVLEAPHCEANLYGLYLLKGDSLADNHTVVDNKATHCVSNELYKGILDEKSTGVFNGKIFVRQIAQKTNAFQSNKNVLLSDEATINTKPQLEIWADDVKCSHGSTTGSLDEEALFYLRSRGLGAKEAKAFLLSAFASDVLGIIKDEVLKDYLQNLISLRLQQN